MNRWFPRPGPEALLSLAVTIGALGGACAPTNPVKPGAPILISLSVVESSGHTDITPTTSMCIAGTKEGDDCDPTTNPVTHLPVTPVCQLPTTLCHCVAKAMGDCSINPAVQTTQGTWLCHYGPQATVLATFDRILDGDFLDGGDGGPRTDIATLTTTPPRTDVATSTSYSPNGSTVGLIFPLFGQPLGPSLTVNGIPAMPAVAAVKVVLNPALIQAKDGKTPFSGVGLLQDGTISFLTNSFSATVTVPVAPMPTATGTDDGGADGGVSDDASADGGVSDGGGGADGGSADGGADGGASDGGAVDVATSDASDDTSSVDASEGGAPVCVVPPPAPLPLPLIPGMDAVTISFNNPIDPTMLAMHVTVTVNGTALAPAAYKIDSTMAPTLTLTPVADWPASSTIVVSVDADASDVLGDKLGAVASGQFMTTSGM